MTALNNARKTAGEKEVSENDPCMYAMENKTAWRIDGGKWKDVCSLSGCLIVIRDIVTDRLHTCIKHHPTSESQKQSVIFFFSMDVGMGFQHHTHLQHVRNQETHTHTVGCVS